MGHVYKRMQDSAAGEMRYEPHLARGGRLEFVCSLAGVDGVVGCWGLSCGCVAQAGIRGLPGGGGGGRSIQDSSPRQVL